ncbi:hypothetical protein D3C86_1066160 [compost metagenome]
MQHRAHIDVLEIQRKLLAAVGLLPGIALLQLVDRRRANADRELIVSLIGRVIERAAGLNADDGSIAARAGIDELHGRGEILHVQTHAQRLGQSGFGKADDDLAVALLYVGRNRWIRQVDHHVAFALGSPLEIHTPNGLACRRGGSCRNRRCCGRLPGCRRFDSLPDNYQQIVAFNSRVVRGRLGQVDDQSRTVPGFHHRRTSGISTAQIVSLARQLTGDTRQIQGNPGWRIRRVAVGHRGRRIERQLQLDTVTRQRSDIQRLEIGRLYHRRQQRYP